MTVTGHHLDSVAEPRITVTVVVTTSYNDTFYNNDTSYNNTSYNNTTNSTSYKETSEVISAAVEGFVRRPSCRTDVKLKTRPTCFLSFVVH